MLHRARGKDRDNTAMNVFLVLVLLGIVAHLIKSAEQRQRIALLSQRLQPYQLEKLIEQLTSGYLRALGESDPERSEPIWRMLEGTEKTLADPLGRLASDVAAMNETDARVSLVPEWLPMTRRWLPGATFDLRQAIALHARGFAEAAQNAAGLGRKQQAFTLTAELFLFQHTCHWYCRSKPLASARLWARHQTRYEQVLGSVSATTRAGYGALVGRSV
jgi:hypothetical protein